MKKRRSEIEESIQRSRQEEAEFRRGQQRQVREYERFQRTSVAKSRQAKVADVREGELQEAQGLSRVRLEQARAVEELEKLELLMLHKQAHSRMSSEKSELQLKELLGRGKAKSYSIAFAGHK